MFPFFIDNDVILSGFNRKRTSMVDKTVYGLKNNNEIIKSHIAHISEDLKEEGYQPKAAKGYIKGNLVICEITYMAVVQ